ncbi:AraC family transcriptional regulator [Prevotella sp. 10(H)]|uniref:helix-turn-helix domain-containing protein n=1 Tax=Prevotella sp. 10(H) TaxID=1158294 RepID=UPI0004A704F7|nr:AraC family transcriptional regulator [Prevotella sp. 10(H)]
MSKSDTIVYNYMDTFFCCHVEKDKLCEEMVTEHMLVYICSGEMILQTREKRMTFKKGDAVFMKRNHLAKKTKAPTKSGEPFKGLFLQLRTPFLKSLLAEAKFPVSINSYSTNRDKNYKLLPKHPFITGLFMSLEQYFDSQTYPSKELMTIKLKEAVLALLEADPSLASVLFDFAEPWKMDLSDFMNKNYRCDMSLEEFAHYTGRSLTSFKRDFFNIFQETPGKWLVKQRLHDAYNQIVNRKQKPSEIYQEVGFKNLSHFSKAFKKEFGRSPANMDF